MGTGCGPYPDITSPSQRKWIYQRDQGLCQMPTLYIPGIPIAFSSCGEVGQEVHHIWPKRAFTSQTRNDPHTQWNLILLCRYHHWKIHPDMANAFKEKHKGNPNALEELFERRQQSLNNGNPYWVTTWDEILKIIAAQRTKRFLSQNPSLKYPMTHYVGQTTSVY